MAQQTIQIENSINESIDLIKSVITIINGKIQTEEEKSLKWIYRYEKVDIDMYTNLLSDDGITSIKTIAIHPNNKKDFEENVLNLFNSNILEDILTIPYKPIISFDYEDFFGENITQETLTLKNNTNEIIPHIKEIIKNINGQILEENENKIIWAWEYQEEYIKCLTILNQIGGLSKMTTFSIAPERKKFNERVAINKLHIPLLNNPNIQDFNSLKFTESVSKNIFCPHCGKELSLPQHLINQPILNCSNCEKKFPNILIPNYSEVESENEIEKFDNRTTDPFAVITFACGLGGFIILPILFIPIGIISNFVSYYRIRENPNLKGDTLRIVGGILILLNIFWLWYIIKKENENPITWWFVFQYFN
ncbi:MAG TPA: hypothetical protein VKY36_00860 [Moheibacter sp.]|nr:hypothetical protein [Moheibacter sp.]